MQDCIVSMVNVIAFSNIGLCIFTVIAEDKITDSKTMVYIH